MKSIISLIVPFCFCLLNSNVYCQDQFQVTSLTNSECSIKDFQHSLGGGTFLLGESQQSGTSFIELQKLLLDFSADWAYNFSAIDSTIHPGAIMESSDRGFVTAAQIVQSGNPGDPSSDILLFKTDEQGQLLWSRRIDHYYSDRPNSILNSQDGSIYLASQATTTTISPSYSISLLKCDSTGNVLWSKSIGGGGNEIASKMILTSDDQLAIAGTSSSFSSGTSFFLSKLDTSGNYYWFQTYFTGFADTCYGLLQTNDAGYLLTGSGGLDGNDILLIKTDQNGIVQNSHSFNLGFGSNKNLDKGIRVLNTSDGGYAIAGESKQNGSDLPFFFIIKLSQNLVIEWYNTYGFQLKNSFASFLEMADKGFLLSGGRVNFGTTGMRNLMVKTDSIGNSDCLQTILDLSDQVENPFSASASPATLSTITSQSNFALSQGIPVYTRDTACYTLTMVNTIEQSNSFSTFPNPFQHKFSLALGADVIFEPIDIQITDQTGRILYSQEKVSLPSSGYTEINLPDFKPGIFFLYLKNKDKIIEVKKIICSY